MARVRTNAFRISTWFSLGIRDGCVFTTSVSLCSVEMPFDLCESSANKSAGIYPRALLPRFVGSVLRTNPRTWDGGRGPFRSRLLTIGALVRCFVNDARTLNPARLSVVEDMICRVELYYIHTFSSIGLCPSSDFTGAFSQFIFSPSIGLLR